MKVTLSAICSILLLGSLDASFYRVAPSTPGPRRQYDRFGNLISSEQPQAPLSGQQPARRIISSSRLVGTNVGSKKSMWENVGVQPEPFRSSPPSPIRMMQGGVKDRASQWYSPVQQPPSTPPPRQVPYSGGKVNKWEPISMPGVNVASRRSSYTIQEPPMKKMEGRGNMDFIDQYRAKIEESVPQVPVQIEQPEEQYENYFQQQMERTPFIPERPLDYGERSPQGLKPELEPAPVQRTLPRAGFESVKIPQFDQFDQIAPLQPIRPQVQVEEYIATPRNAPLPPPPVPSPPRSQSRQTINANVEQALRRPPPMPMMAPSQPQPEDIPEVQALLAILNSPKSNEEELAYAVSELAPYGYAKLGQQLIQAARKHLNYGNAVKAATILGGEGVCAEIGREQRVELPKSLTDRSHLDTKSWHTICDACQSRGSALSKLCNSL